MFKRAATHKLFISAHTTNVAVRIIFRRSRVRVLCLRLEYLIKTFGKYPHLCLDIYVIVLRRHYDPFL